MAVHKQRGGSQVGWVSASWPLAGIEVSPGKLTITSMGKYEFSPSEVAAIEEIGSFPFVASGIEVHHNKPQYPERIRFHAVFGKAYLVETIRRAGFTVGTPVTKVPRGFPMRWPTVIALIVIWNLLFFLDRPSPDASTWTPGPYVMFGLVALFVLATLLPKSERLQDLFMRDDRDVSEISSMLKLVQLVSGLMLLALGFTRLTQ
jgi:hypothetical protein